MRQLETTSNSASQEDPWRVRLVEGENSAAPPLGAGVLLPGGLVLTCAHVVLSKPRRGSGGSGEAGRRDGPPRPVAPLYAEFPGTRGDPPPRLRAEVLADQLKPPTSTFSADIALLRLASVPPVETAVLHRQIPALNELVHSVGYTDELPGGETINARLMGRGGPARYSEWVQLNPVDESFAVRPGYSGGGVVHTRTGGVIGIMTYRYKDHRFSVDYAYMIPTETILRYLSVLRPRPAGHQDELKVTGRAALSHTIPFDPPRSGSNRALALRRKVTHWLIDAAPATGAASAPAPAPVSDPVSGADPAAGRRTATEPVELVFARDGRPDDISAVYATLNLADRERNPRPADRGDPTEPPVGSIDMAVDAQGRTAGQLIARTAERIGLVGPSGPTGPYDDEGPYEGRGPDEHEGPDDRDRLLARIAGDSPPISAAFLSVDRAAPTGEAVLPLLKALRKGRLTRLLLVFRDPASPLLEDVVDTLLDDAWAERRTTALAARLAVLAELEKRFRRLYAHSGDRGVTDAPRPVYRQLSSRLAELRTDGEVPHRSAALAYDLFLLDIAVEEALQSAGSAVRLLDRPNSPGEYVVNPSGGGLTDLPHITVDDPDAFVEPEPDPGPGPGPGTPTEPEAGLVRGQELHQQYKVVGLLGEGSYGQVYLARDQMLDNRPVALKGVRDPDDPTDRWISRLELLRLVSLNHPSIIKVFNYARHPGHPKQPEHPANKARFIVMEFADGAPLQWVAEQIARNAAPFDGYRVHEFIAVYGLLILDALRHLHEDEGFVYGDLSLTNVIHCGSGIKLIDVAGVRKIGHAGPVTYPAPELGSSTKVTVAADLYAVGAVLQELLDRVPARAADLGTTSLQRVLHRARAPRPEDRFADAQEMSVQLRGVLRELRSLRLDEETFEPSPLFAVAPAALDGELGKAPPLEQWRHGGNDKRPLTIRPPEPAEVAVGLPVPKVSRQDPNWKELQRTSYDDPAGLLQLSADWQLSPELALLRCRLHLEVSRYRSADAGRHLASATAELRRAEAAVGSLAESDWRLRWHQGLLHLAGNDTASALRSFDQVYAAIPGEYAPKLALGYCHEVLDHPREAMVFYSAVWKRNHALGSAAFGLARIHLADGDTRLALGRLEAVPADSRHRTAARTGMARIHADLPADGAPPTVAAAKRAYEALHRLARYEGMTDRQAQDRLRTDLLELLLRLVTTPPEPDPLGALREALDAEIPIPRTEHELRKQLGAGYERLSEQVPRTTLREHRTLERALLDNAFRTRPYAFAHSRGEQRQGRLRGWRPGRLRATRATDPQPGADAAGGER
ncbi:tetratricopeptide repeat protein [Streptomyces sp. NBC_01716]|uniref:tetratricopeptide repeat protein n=1 Tax=Streptomyces sp. NBC_01716 TaxID=2975917 RepID=UPI002E31F7B6|nr:tetratricopeptide repeat protein [Streptomyces sp. NBC_01716]